MQTGKSTVKNIFDGTRIFNVPIYQRAYSWTKSDNLIDFLSDIVNQHHDRKYFLGSFLFHLNGDRNEFSIVDIVDGQQRLTTFIIFINSLIRALIEKRSTLISDRAFRIYVKDGDVYKLETSNEDSSFLHNVILNEKINTVVNFNTQSQRLLAEAKEYFRDAFVNDSTEKLERIFATATNAEVLLYVVDEINSATQIFELLNDRGRKLTDLEAVKSFLMYNAGLVSSNPNQIIKNIQQDFSEIYRIIEKYEINERDVLRYHTIAFEHPPAEYQDKPKAFVKEKITRLVNNRELNIDPIQEIQEYSTRLKNSFVVYSKIQDEKIKAHYLSEFYMIDRVGPYYPILMFYYKEKSDQFKRLVVKLKRFSLLSALTGLRSYGESYLYTCLRNNEDVLTKIQCFTDDNWWDINGRAANVITSSNYYYGISKNVVRYILVVYENSLRNAKGFPLLGFNEYFSTIDREKLSIEHISAQRAKEVIYDEEFNEKYMHSIGNLVIDHVGSNSSKGNKNTNDKICDFKMAPLMSQNEIDESNCDWRDCESIKEFIKHREINLHSFIRSYFQIA